MPTTKTRKLYGFTRNATTCPSCEESETKPFPLYWLGDVEGCEGCLEDEQDAREFDRQNEADWR